VELLTALERDFERFFAYLKMILLLNRITTYTIIIPPIFRASFNNDKVAMQSYVDLAIAETNQGNNLAIYAYTRGRTDERLKTTL